MSNSEGGGVSWRDRLLAAAEAEADRYGEEGWETLELHPGDVTLRPDDDGAAVLDVLVPDNEFERLGDRATEDVDSYRVLRSTPAGVVALLIVLEGTDSRQATFVPAYYEPDTPQAGETFRNALDAGVLTLRLRTLSDDRVEVLLDDPGLLLPDD